MVNDGNGRSVWIKNCLYNQNTSTIGSGLPSNIMALWIWIFHDLSTSKYKVFIKDLGQDGICTPRCRPAILRSLAIMTLFLPYHKSGCPQARIIAESTKILTIESNDSTFWHPFPDQLRDLWDTGAVLWFRLLKLLFAAWVWGIFDSQTSWNQLGRSPIVSHCCWPPWYVRPKPPGTAA